VSQKIIEKIKLSPKNLTFCIREVILTIDCVTEYQKDLWHVYFKHLLCHDKVSMSIYHEIFGAIVTNDSIEITAAIFMIHVPEFYVKMFLKYCE